MSTRRAKKEVLHKLKRVLNPPQVFNADKKESEGPEIHLPSSCATELRILTRIEQNRDNSPEAKFMKKYLLQSIRGKRAAWKLRRAADAKDGENPETTIDKETIERNVALGLCNVLEKILKLKVTNTEARRIRSEFERVFGPSWMEVARNILPESLMESIVKNAAYDEPATSLIDHKDVPRDDYRAIRIRRIKRKREQSRQKKGGSVP
eukprot:CAMPEP_0184492214 /NCGR_PEP_ID=MMETSP0113_2-20130426/22635_1 /TAXON_ID=91329 /ORGANISM="Norrisiella sphaerica, Strain BC52" /LENGTH=207 /DNA_ID=CAMNT_0026876893 /DNA_START=223 /DNA_END=846 /DNA_ORIENTATION=-